MRSKRYLFLCWISGFAGLIDDLFVILTFGFWSPSLTMKVLCIASDIEAKIWEKKNVDEKETIGYN
jgi:hypothetical protein